MDIILMKIGVKKMNLKINEIMNEDDKPLYFYHLVDKNADMSKGIISLQYMYDNKMDDLFDKNIIKYKFFLILSKIVSFLMIKLVSCVFFILSPYFLDFLFPI